jgi:predicted Zn-dependent peptidase
MRITNPLRGACAALAALLLTAGNAQAGFERINAPDPLDPMAVAIYRLDNGLEVHLTENHEQPRFYAEIAVRAGSKMDPAETTGLAHYLEHLLFKGSQEFGTLDYAKEKEHLDRIVDLYEAHFKETDPEKRKAIYAQINEASVAASQYAVPNELDRLYEEMGASLVNAHTSDEETVYKVGLPSNRLAQWATLEAERFRAPVFRLFQTELETVYEELNRWMDNKDTIIRDAVLKALYKKHPYGQQPTIGLAEHLKNPSLKNIQHYYDTYYVPNNMAIFISGDIDTAATIALIDAHFGAWKSKPLPAPGAWEEAPLQGREYVERQYPGEEFAMLTFRTVAKSHPDAEALILMDMIMDNASAGLINLNLNQQQRVRQAGSFPDQNNDYGAEFFYGIPKDGQTLEDVEKLLLEQVELVKQGAFEDWLIPAIINDFKKNQKAGLEDDTARVSMMREAWIGHEPWDHAVRQIERMEKLTRDDVIRVANQYFGKDYVCGFRKDAQHEVPAFPKPELAKIDIDPTRESAFGKALRAIPVTPIEPVFIDPAKDYVVQDDPRGRKLYHVHNPINDIFNFSIVVDFGTHEDNTIQVAAMLLDKSGTEKFSAEDLQKEWYKLGTTFSVSAGDNETTISLTGLDENFEASLALLLDLLQHPKSDPDVLEQMKRIILVQREDSRKQPQSIAAALVEYNRFGNESVFLRMLPSEALLALKQEQLYASIARLLDYKHAVTYTGALPVDQVAAVVVKQFPVKEALQDPPPYRYQTLRAPEATEILFVDKETAQANIRIEYGTELFSEARRTAIDLYNNYFGGGMSGIVFQELREARALAYSAGAVYRQGYRAKDQDVMIGVIQSQNDKAPEALSIFVDLIDQLPVSEERFAIAKESLINQYRTGKVGFRGVIGVLRTWERQGLSPDPRAHRFAELQNATMQTMLDFHSAVIKQKPKLVSVVGDPAKIDMAAIEKAGTVRKVTVDELFVK